MNKFYTLFVVLLGFISLPAHSQGEVHVRQIELTAADKLTITADLYMCKSKSAPLIILFHQARYSRGEYQEIAPQLNALGFNCLAIDQRSGDAVNGVNNLTHERAVEQDLKTEYINAIPDMEAAILFAKNQLKAPQIIIWGSSYSAELVFYLGSKYSKDIAGILAFSPGAYFDIDGRNIVDFAAKADCPVFITSAKNEQEQWQGIYDAITSYKHFYLPENEGLHGSKALWSDHEDSEEYWKEVKDFLAILK